MVSLSFGRNSAIRGMALLLAVVALILVRPAFAAEDPEPIRLQAKAMWLSDALKSRKIPADLEMTTLQVVLVEPGGAIRPILRDEASRALFLDERLRNRDLEVQARRYPGLPYLQVVSFRVRHEGKWRTPEYYCDICTISVRYPQVCPCCQGDMEFRMKPEAD